MAKILCVWEMGSSLGHLTNLKLFIDEAQKQGHQVSLVVRELQNVATVFDISGIQLFQAPVIRHPPRRYSTPTISFSQLILRQVFTNREELTALYHSWNSLFESVQPDLVIYDHSPSALIASHGKPWTKWVIGNGFFVPRTDGHFFGVFPGTLKNEQNDEQLMMAEQQLLSLINAVLEEDGRPTMPTVKDIYRQSDQQLLLTLPELDHFGRRPDQHYLGLTWNASTNPPQWLSDSDGIKQAGEHRVKAFAYLSYFPGLPKLLDALLAWQVDVLIYARDLPGSLVSEYSDRVTFNDKPVDLKVVYKEASFVITHGNHTSAAQAYAMGCPQLLLPKHQEQLFLCQRVEQQKRAVLAFMQQPDFTEAVGQLMALPKIAAYDSAKLDSDEQALYETIRQLLENLT